MHLPVEETTAGLSPVQAASFLNRIAIEGYQLFIELPLNCTAARHLFRFAPVAQWIEH